MDDFGINNFSNLFADISNLIEESKRRAYQTINWEIVILYWNVGNIINKSILLVNRAEYGKQMISKLSKELLLKYGKGYNEIT